MNLFKWGISLSIGWKGFRLTLGKSNIRATFGFTGTGLFLTKNMHTTKDLFFRAINPFPESPKLAEMNKVDNSHYGKKED